MQNQSTPPVKLDRGIHVMHLFYSIDRTRWATLSPEETARACTRLKELGAANAAACAPRLNTYAGVGGKCDLGFMIFAADGAELGRLHRSIEACFPAGTLERVFTYLSVTELSEYASTEEDSRHMLIQHEKLQPDTPEFQKRLEEANRKRAEYEHYRLYPEMQDWEVMCFYPMNKRRATGDNWYLLDFATRKKLMGSHARTGRRFAGRVSQLITGSTGLDDWEWGVTLIAHQMDAIKEIVYDMRFDEVSARFGEFGPFYVNLRMPPEALWSYLGL